tara:strand:- start:1976 stop:2284 length:309 start_codon:yes stop_codon:yes gene_type:complete
MKRRNPDIQESVILEKQDDLFYELLRDGEINIDGSEVVIFTLFEFVDGEDMENVFSALVRGNEDAKENATEILWQAFRVMFDDEVIERHIISEGEEFEAEEW